nr:DUF2332 family protein [Actinoplanes rectilineatus]
MITADVYTEFAAREAAGSSPAYQALATAVAADDRLLALLDTLPAAKRQPNLLFAVVRYLDGPVDDVTRFLTFAVDDWPRIADAAWLQALVWPEHDARRTRQSAAARTAAADPARLIRGDLADALPALAAQAPTDATLVVFHTSVLYQVPAERREIFLSLVRETPCQWLSIEVPEVLDQWELPPPPAPTLHNVLSLNGEPLAWARPHGDALHWFGPVHNGPLS